MKTTSLTREIILWFIILVPLAYLALSWNELPERVPVHFNVQGEADGWAGKTSLIGIVFLTTVVMNLLLLLIPKIDPKRKLAYMGSKYDQLRFILVGFMAALAMFVIYNAVHEDTFQINILFLLLGAMFVGLGNYFQAIKPNYFIGIRTPWTLESEHVWRKTHRLGGRLWMIGGLLMMVLALLPFDQFRQVLFLVIVGVLVLIPVIYSFLESRKEQRMEGQV
ncbi:SdpI family protein [Pontibacter ruber]|uniref:SdpI family protein n=1 Tax=Pontibacter ruber TaxID=1343895 RepID=A0ABW5D2A4_9BACT|nr:SdpI family protein [Pontibacter ruber]